uniref:sphingosine kinase n=1 Tax=Hucho hucho TaxID=62062 RepID=A0A4W5R8Z1_9TELE
VDSSSSRRGVHRPCSVMLLVNPHSGKGQALSLFTGHVQRMLNEAGVPHTLVITERQNHARELVREADLSQWGALVIMSGDGLLFEVVNGLMEREDWEEAIQTPLGILPGGSGNALAASIHHYSGAQPVSSEELLVSCGFLLCKGLVSRMDLASVHLGSSPSNPTRLFSFLSLAWGFVADVDVESEKVYKGRLAYLPVDEREPMSANATLPGPPDSLLVPLDQPVPSDWVVVPEEDFVLMLAMYQSHLAKDLYAAPDSTLDDGLIHLIYIRAGISRTALLRLFLAMEKGTHLANNCPHLVYTRVRALRLEPYSPKGVITVDGEVVEYGPVQAQVHGGIARLITR